jgi:hypothetical protein
MLMGERIDGNGKADKSQSTFATCQAQQQQRESHTFHENII